MMVKESTTFPKKTFPNAAKGTNQDIRERAQQVQVTRKDEVSNQSRQSPPLNLEPLCKP
jgi:hypothetical protein